MRCTPVALVPAVSLLLAAGSLTLVAAQPATGVKTSTDAIYKTSYRVVDVHGHAPFPSEKALRAHLQVLDRVGVAAFTVLLYEPEGWAYAGGWSDPNLLEWLELRKRYPDRQLVFGTVDFRRAAKEPRFWADIVGELDRAVRLGMQGVKIWKNLGMHYPDKDGKLLRIDDPRLDPFWARCGELGVPVFIHAADPKEYWYPRTYNTYQYESEWTARYHNHPVVPRWEDLIAQRDAVVRRHPKTTFIGAHFASLSSDFDGLARTLDALPNLFVECGARLRFLYRYHPHAVRDFFVRYQDRILFGTDNALADAALVGNAEALRQFQDRRAVFYSRHLEYFETDHLGIIEPGGSYREWMRLTGVKLPPAVLEKFYHGNAEKLIPGLKPPGGK
jgi:predicted TIM-barrel fold metal-dependent hydrolase